MPVAEYKVSADLGPEHHSPLLKPFKTFQIKSLEFQTQSQNFKMFKYLVALALVMVAVSAAPPAPGAPAPGAAPKDLQTANQLLYGYGAYGYASPYAYASPYYTTGYSGYYGGYPGYGYAVYGR